MIQVCSDNTTQFEARSSGGASTASTGTRGWCYVTMLQYCQYNRVHIVEASAACCNCATVLRWWALVFRESVEWPRNIVTPASSPSSRPGDYSGVVSYHLVMSWDTQTLDTVIDFYQLSTSLTAAGCSWVDTGRVMEINVVNLECLVKLLIRTIPWPHSDDSE